MRRLKLIAGGAIALLLGLVTMPAAASPAGFARAGASVQPDANRLLQLALVVPPPALARSSPKPDPNLFGSVALQAGGIAARTKWDRVLAEHADAYLSEPCSAGAPNCGGSWNSWRSLIASAKTLPAAERLGAVNRGVNRLVQHTSDQINYGTSDYWAMLAETVQRGRGDCEDYAIAKMWLLAALGLPIENMQLVVLADKWRNIPHAVLAVHIDGRAYILDNLMDRVVLADTITHYKPVYSLMKTTSFVHGVRVGKKELALQPAGALVPLPVLRSYDSF